MAKLLFIILIFTHGLIHTMGFFKSFRILEIEQLTVAISRSQGVLWMIAFLLFFISTVLFHYNIPIWPNIAIISVILSQALIISSWTDAKYGTIANIIILVTAIFSFATLNFTRQYQKDVSISLARTNNLKEEILEEQDLEHLPYLVQNYLRITGVLGRPKVHNAKIIMEGQMRGKDQHWFQFKSEQYNFFHEPSRFFFMRAKVKGLATYGYHRYNHTKASMLIKVLGLFPVISHTGPEMDTAETVTLFNDMCVMAPATLIDKNITWTTLDDQTVAASFTNNHITIHATLHFNDRGQLIDFRSDDRYEVPDMKQYPFSTPLSKYSTSDQYHLCTYGEAIWHYPDSIFKYGQFNIKRVEYNVNQ